MEKKGKIRKCYEKPQITQVKLEIEEAVLQACKTGPGSTDGKTPGPGCGGSACQTIYGS